MTLAHDDATATLRKIGRPTEYKPEYATAAAKLCEFGALDADLAQAFQVDIRTIERWRVSHPDFCRAVKVSKEIANDAVVRSLYHRARGYTFESEKVMQYEGEVIRVPIREHCPPDPTSMIFWLKNRCPEEWRDVSERNVKHEVTLQVSSKLERVLARRALDAPNTVQVIEHKPINTDSD